MKSGGHHVVLHGCGKPSWLCLRGASGFAEPHALTNTGALISTAHTLPRFNHLGFKRLPADSRAIWDPSP